MVSPAGTALSADSNGQMLSFALSNTTINSNPPHQDALHSKGNYFSARSRFGQESLSTVQESEHVLINSQTAVRPFYHSNSTLEPSDSYASHSRN